MSNDEVVCSVKDKDIPVRGATGGWPNMRTRAEAEDYVPWHANMAVVYRGLFKKSGDEASIVAQAGG